jgi:hypothetical protein
MTLLQLHLFAWVAAWVLAESITPGISYDGKFQASLIATMATAFAYGTPRIVWTKLRAWMK